MRILIAILGALGSVPILLGGCSPAGPAPTAVRLTEIGETAVASSEYPGWPASRAIDGDLETSWFADSGDCANPRCGTAPFIEVQFPADITVTAVGVRGNREYAEGYDIFSGYFELFNAAGEPLIFPVVDLPGPDRDLMLELLPQGGVRRVRFTSTDDESNEPGLAELEVYGW